MKTYIYVRCILRPDSTQVPSQLAPVMAKLEELARAAMRRMDELTRDVAHLTQHTVPCTRKDGEQPYKCAYHPQHRWPSHLCPEHAKRVGQPHRDLEPESVDASPALYPGALSFESCRVRAATEEQAYALGAQSLPAIPAGTLTWNDYVIAESAN